MVMLLLAKRSMMNSQSNTFYITFRLYHLFNNEKQAREETEEAFLDMLRSVINKIKVELDNEKKDRYIIYKYVILKLIENKLKKPY